MNEGAEHPARRGRSSRPKNPGAGLRFAAGSRHALRGSEGPAGASAPCVPTATETPPERGSVIRRDHGGPIGLSRVAGPSRWRVTTASSRGSRSGRSRIAWVARRRRSRPTSTTPPATRRGPSRRATSACAAAVARTRSRATARATRTRTASAAIRARSSVAGPAKQRPRSDARVARALWTAPHPHTDWSQDARRSARQPGARAAAKR